MAQEKTEAFIQWLDDRLAEDHLTDFQLAKKAGISHSVISKARKGILPKWNACTEIARALRVDPIEIYRAAGLIQSPPDLDPDFERLKQIYSTLPTLQRKLPLRLIRVRSEEN